MPISVPDSVQLLMWVHTPMLESNHYNQLPEQHLLFLTKVLSQPPVHYELTSEEHCRKLLYINYIIKYNIMCLKNIILCLKALYSECCYKAKHFTNSTYWLQPPDFIHFHEFLFKGCHWHYVFCPYKWLTKVSMVWPLSSSGYTNIYMRLCSENTVYLGNMVV